MIISSSHVMPVPGVDDPDTPHFLSDVVLIKSLFLIVSPFVQTFRLLANVFICRPSSLSFCPSIPYVFLPAYKSHVGKNWVFF